MVGTSFVFWDLFAFFSFVGLSRVGELVDETCDFYTSLRKFGLGFVCISRSFSICWSGEPFIARTGWR